MDELSYLAGLIAGDGHLENKTNKIVIFSSGKEFVDSLGEILKIVIEKRSVFYDRNAKEWKVSFYSRELQDLLIKDYGLLKGSKSRTVKFPENAKDVKSYMSGLFDAEGWFEKDKEIYLRIRLKMKSEKLVKSVSDNLKSFFIESRFHKRKDGTFVVEINSQKDVRKFMNNFSLLHPKWLQLRFLLAAKAPNLLGYIRRVDEIKSIGKAFPA